MNNNSEIQKKIFEKRNKYSKNLNNIYLPPISFSNIASEKVKSMSF